MSGYGMADKEAKLGGIKCGIVFERVCRLVKIEQRGLTARIYRVVRETST
jgi:hypothetical protein